MTERFGALSTTEDVLEGINLQGKRYLVTGVSSVGMARNLDNAESATAAVHEGATAGGGSFEVVALDLADLGSVRTAADKLIADGRTFDAVIANAGMMACPSDAQGTVSKLSSAPTTSATSC